MAEARPPRTHATGLAFPSLSPVRFTVGGVWLCLCLLTAACSGGGAVTTAPPPVAATAAVPPPTTTPPQPSTAPTATISPPQASATPTPAPTATPLPAFPVEPLAWEPCGGSFDCARLTVPVDHADPTGATMELAVIRVPAADQDRRIGSVMINPGGPGAPGTSFLRRYLGALPGVERHFDIVSWDPRGVGDSAGLRCVDDVAGLINEVETPDDGFADDLARDVADNRDIGAACKATAGDLVDNVGTVATARDLELLRRAVGDDRLTYIGYSYGTRIGAVYAALFPHRVRALVLDGAFPPGLDSRQLAENVVDLEATLARIDRTCSLEPGCAVKDPGVVATVDRLLDELDAITPGDPLGLTDRSALIGATLFAIYVPNAWQDYTEALGAARNGDLGPIERFAALWYVDDGDFSDIHRGANRAIMCADRAYAIDREAALGDALEPLEEAPVLGPVFAGATCEGWPAEGEALPRAGAEPVAAMVIGTTHDPATPLRWAETLARDLPGSALVTHVGDGHTVAGRGNRCIDDLVEGFLVALTPPPEGATCRAPTGVIGLVVAGDRAPLQVTDVAPGGPADDVGIRVGDTIVAVDGRAADTVDALTSTAGQRLELTVLRDGDRLSVDLVADRRPWTLGD